MILDNKLVFSNVGKIMLFYGLGKFVGILFSSVFTQLKVAEGQIFTRPLAKDILNAALLNILLVVMINHQQLLSGIYLIPVID